MHDEHRLTTALTYGTFDLFHIGHARLFQRIKERFDRLIVAVSTDAFNEQKGKQSVMPYADRVEIVRACRWVDAVIPEIHWAQKADDIQRLGADALVMGDDWEGVFDHFSNLCEVVYLPRTQVVSSSQLKRSVAEQMARGQSRVRYLEGQSEWVRMSSSPERGQPAANPTLAQHATR